MGVVGNQADAEVKGNQTWISMSMALVTRSTLLNLFLHQRKGIFVKVKVTIYAKPGTQ